MFEKLYFTCIIYESRILLRTPHAPLCWFHTWWCQYLHFLKAIPNRCSLDDCHNHHSSARPTGHAPKDDCLRHYRHNGIPVSFVDRPATDILYIRSQESIQICKGVWKSDCNGICYCKQVCCLVSFITKTYGRMQFTVLAPSRCWAFQENACFSLIVYRHTYLLVNTININELNNNHR